MRAFLGLEVPESSRRILSGIRVKSDGGDGTYPGLRWTRPENLHLTVRFLGDIDESVGGVLISRLRGALRSFGSLSIRIEEVTWFPTRRPTVLAAIVTRSSRLIELSAIIEAEVVKAGLPPESRPLNPHITVSRLRQPGAGHIEEMHESVGTEFECQKLVLFQSRLLPTGPLYTHFGEIALVGEQ